ncbi:enoyl-CoA hydratase/isomerase family protein [Rhodococcus triatomae]|nr:enoyl-CoA hydratase [Rhodococcus triatomae BKS 15-14]
MTIDVTFDGRAASVTFGRRGSLNALDLDTVSGLADAFDGLARRNDIDVVVLAAGEPGFCSGGDLGFVAEHLDDLDSAVDRFLDRSDALVTALLTMPQVTISAVDGVAAGAGMSLAAAADLCVCSDRSTFVPAYARLGVPPDLGGSVTLPRRLGSGRATNLLLLRSRLDAPTALGWGLVDEVMPTDGFSEHLSASVSRILGLGSQELRATKRMVGENARGRTLDAALADERRQLKAAMSTPSYVRKIGEFIAGAH